MFVLTTSMIHLVFHPSNPPVIRTRKGGLSCYLKNKALILQRTMVFLLSKLLRMPQVRRSGAATRNAYSQGKKELPTTDKTKQIEKKNE